MAKKGPPGKESGDRSVDRSADPAGTGDEGARTFGKRAAPVGKDGKFSLDNNTPAPSRRWGWTEEDAAAPPPEAADDQPKLSRVYKRSTYDTNDESKEIGRAHV